MKKIIFFAVIPILILVLNTRVVFADEITAPVVSIGVGNGNSPENTGPVHGNTYSGDISVFATVTDDDADNYHFRVVKDGEIDGYTCTEDGGLFALENQGYASTTLGKDACGFVFNQSVYVSPTGFTNSLIATLNASDIIAFSGEGDYWLILGAVDTAGNRTNSNYLNDSKIKITVSSTTPVVVVPPVPAPVVSGGGGGGNGPIANSYGVVPGGYAPVAVVNPSAFILSTTSNASTVSHSNSGSGEAVLADGGITPEDYINLNTGTENISTSSNEISATTSSDLLAQVISSGFNFNWLWLLILLLILGGTYYFYFVKD